MNYFYEIDMETLSIDKKCVILSIGAIAVKNIFPINSMGDIERIPAMTVYPDLDEQIKMGRVIDVDTLKWWTRNPDIYVDLMNKKREDPFKCVRAMFQFLCDHGFNKNNTYIWSRGLYDRMWFESLCNDIDPINKLAEDYIIPYYRWIDTRTICSVFNPDTKIIDEDFSINKHTSTTDCIRDYLLLTQGSGRLIYGGNN